MLFFHTTYIYERANLNAKYAYEIHESLNSNVVTIRDGGCRKVLEEQQIHTVLIGKP
jgi:hypothetical protein